MTISFDSVYSSRWPRKPSEPAASIRTPTIVTVYSVGQPVEARAAKNEKDE